MLMYVTLQVKIEELVTEMGGALQTKTSLDLNFVIVKNVLAAKYKVWYMKSLFYISILFLIIRYILLEVMIQLIFFSLVMPQCSRKVDISIYLDF